MRSVEPLRPTIGFAHRGARAHAPENTLEAFQLGLRLGATGLESDVWLTSDGEAVLEHDGVVRRGWRRTPIREIARTDLPSHIPTLAELYEACGSDFELSLDVKDRRALDAVLRTVRDVGGDAPARLWLCHHDVDQVMEWRRAADDVRFVDSTRKAKIREGVERRAARLAEAGVDALNLHHTDWSAGMVALVHRFEVHAFAWDAQFERVLDGLVGIGVDGIYSDHVDRLVDALARA